MRRALDGAAQAVEVLGVRLEGVLASALRGPLARRYPEAEAFV